MILSKSWREKLVNDGLINRRTVLRSLGAITTVGAVPQSVFAHDGEGENNKRTQSFVLTTEVVVAGKYHYLPFKVPEGVNRIDVNLNKNGHEKTKVGLGLFDYRGAHYGSDGFRGVYGEERSEFFISARNASQSFLPGRIKPGTYTVIVPVFRAPTPTTISVRIIFTFGPKSQISTRNHKRDVVNANSGWYRGDLHCHTPASSDAWASGSALSPAEWRETARKIGLDFISLTDHNVITQNYHLTTGDDTETLLIGGEEMTNWFHGHATVIGLDPGEWLDWRQRPAGVPLGEHETRIQQFFAEVDRLGAYAAAAHPTSAHLSWQFFADGETDPAARPHGLEVWNGNWDPTDASAVAKWDDLLRRGWRVWANGGSDTHGTKNPSLGHIPGNPTTVVYANSLSQSAVVDSLKRGRSFITHSPKGPELYLSATGPDGQRAMIGGTVQGEATDTILFSVEVHRGVGKRLHTVRDGELVQMTPITDEKQTVTVEQPVGAGGYVRIELRGNPEVVANEPFNSQGDMAALTNPIFIERKQ